ncbi:MAG: matrixin family metalloprotease [Vicinamibacterales bacterium]
MNATRRFVVGAALVAAIVLTTGTTTRGFSTLGSTWANGNIVMHLQLGASSGTLIDGASSWGSVAESALSIWNNYLNNARFTVIRDSTVSKGDGDLVNNVYFDSAIYGAAFGANTLAVTTRWTRGGSARVEADVIFNTKYSWNSYRGNLRSGVEDFRRVAIHEFGHAFGLDHPDDYGQSVNAIMNSIIGNLDTLASDDIQGAQSLYGGGVSGNVSFPPRNEPNDFYAQLLLVYQNTLRAGQSATYLDPEGAVIWLTEYARQRVGQCTHATAEERTLAQITGTGGTLVCALTPVGAIPFPPRNEGLLFMNDLNATYRDTLKRSQGTSFVDNEGAVVWVLEYLRYRLNGCGHGDAATRVFQQILGQGIQPVCR